MYYLQVSLFNNENKSIIENSYVSYWPIDNKSIINRNDPTHLCSILFLLNSLANRYARRIFYRKIHTKVYYIITKINWNGKLKGNKYSRLWLYTEIKKIISIYPILILNFWKILDCFAGWWWWDKRDRSLMIISCRIFRNVTNDLENYFNKIWPDLEWVKENKNFPRIYSLGSTEKST